MRVIALLALCVAAVTAVPSNPQRIVGGSVTTISQYPSISSLLYSWNLNTYTQACGGTIINNRSILSAAHCFIGDTASRWRIRVGSTWANSGGAVHNVANIIIHASYNPNNNNADIAILRTASNIAFNVNVAQGSIPSPNYNLADNQIVYAAGWGAISQGGASSEQLRHVQIWTINQNTCVQRYNEVNMLVNANMLCAGWLDVGGRDQCQGDSGGPLYHNNVVVGVCSFGWGCAQARYPGVNVRVSQFTSWIQANA